MQALDSAHAARGLPRGKKRRRKKTRRAMPPVGLREEELFHMQQKLFASARQHVEATAAPPPKLCAEECASKVSTGWTAEEDFDAYVNKGAVPLFKKSCDKLIAAFTETAGAICNLSV